MFPSAAPRAIPRNPQSNDLSEVPMFVYGRFVYWRWLVSLEVFIAIVGVYLLDGTAHGQMYVLCQDWQIVDIQECRNLSLRKTPSQRLLMVVLESDRRLDCSPVELDPEARQGSICFTLR